MTKYKIICEAEDFDQYIDADYFGLEEEGKLILFDEGELMIAAFTKDFWKAIRIADDFIPCCIGCGGTLEEQVTYHCEKCGDNGEA